MSEKHERYLRKKRNGFFVPADNYCLIDSHTLAYAAGLFDGEGCISFQRNGRSDYIRISISNTDKSIVLYLQSLFGGTVAEVKRPQSHWKRSYQWILTWTRAVAFLRAVRPWLRIKAPQADVAFKWSDLRLGSGKWDKSYESDHLAQKAQLRETLKRLNKRGISEVSDATH